MKWCRKSFFLQNKWNCHVASKPWAFSAFPLSSLKIIYLEVLFKFIFRGTSFQRQKKYIVMPFNKQCDIKENICKSDGPDNQCTYKPLSYLTYLYLQKKTVHFKNFSNFSFLQYFPRLRVRSQQETTSAFPKLLQLLMLKPFSSNIPPGWEWDCRSSKY